MSFIFVIVMPCQKARGAHIEMHREEGSLQGIWSVMFMKKITVLEEAMQKG